MPSPLTIVGDDAALMQPLPEVCAVLDEMPIVEKARKRCGLELGLEERARWNAQTQS